MSELLILFKNLRVILGHIKTSDEDAVAQESDS